MLKATNINPTKEVQAQPNVARLITSGRYLLYVLALIPGLLMLVWVVRFTAGVPFLDEWDFLPIILKLHTGGFTLNDFWIQHNEHRAVVLRIIALGLALLGGWDQLKEVLFSWATVVLSLFVTWQLLQLTVSGWLRVTALVVYSFLLFSTVQYENWLWGFQIAWFLINFLLLVAVWATNRWPGRAIGFYLALGVTIVATYTHGMSLPIWPCILVGMLGRWRTWRKRYLAGWLAAAIASIGLYFYGYTFSRDHKDMGYVLTHLPDVLAYSLTYLATPWAHGLAGIIFSSVGIVSVAAASIYMWWLSYKATPAGTDGRLQSWYSIVPWLTIILFVLLNAGITTLGRLGLGVEQAESSRYATIAIWFWVAGFTIIALALSRFWQRWPALRTGIASLSLVLSLSLIALYSTNYLTGYKNMEAWYQNINQSIPFFYDYANAPDAALSRIYPAREALRQYFWSLDQYNESIFTPAKRAAHAAEQLADLKTYNTPGNRLYNYPPERMTITGDADETQRKLGPETLSFIHSGPYPTSISFEVKDFAKQIETNSTNRTLYITTNEVWYVTIYWYWYTNNILTRVESTLLYPIKDDKGQRVFVVTPPADFQNFKVEFNYSTGRELSENIKVDMYRKN